MYYEPRKTVRGTALAAELQEQFGDKLFCSHPPHMAADSPEWDERVKVMASLYSFAEAACEWMRSQIDEDDPDALIPSWLPELEAAVKACTGHPTPEAAR